MTKNCVPKLLPQIKCQHGHLLPMFSILLNWVSLLSLFVCQWPWLKGIHGSDCNDFVSWFTYDLLIKRWNKPFTKYHGYPSKENHLAFLPQQSTTHRGMPWAAFPTAVPWPQPHLRKTWRNKKWEPVHKIATKGTLPNWVSCVLLPKKRNLEHDDRTSEGWCEGLPGSQTNNLVVFVDLWTSIDPLRRVTWKK